MRISTILTRNPIIQRPLSEFEQKYTDYRFDTRLEKSKNVFKLSEMSSSLAKLEKKTVNFTVENFKISSFPERKLYFLINQDGEWRFPGVFGNKDLTLSDLKRQSLSGFCKETLVYWIGNAPMAASKAGDEFYFKAEIVKGSSAWDGCKSVWCNKEQVKDFVKGDVWSRVNSLLSY